MVPPFDKGGFFAFTDAVLLTKKRNNAILKIILLTWVYKNVNLAKYPDYSSVHDWAKEPLQWANYNNMITGTQQGYINPQGATQRIHATRILYGFGKLCNIGNFE